MIKQELISFEDDIALLFNEGVIHSPVHLSKGNEDALIKIFVEIKPTDWVFSNHRNHLHALLHGVPADWLKKEILENRSIHINNAEHRFFSSAIVAGCCPIAVGVALAIKKQGGTDKVFVFCGDMAAHTGIFYESVRYSEGFDLPITFIVEDNGLSVNSPTDETWGDDYHGDKISYYDYKLGWPHSGSGKWLKF